MREIRQSGSEGGGIETNRSFLPLSLSFERQNSGGNPVLKKCDVHHYYVGMNILEGIGCTPHDLQKWLHKIPYMKVKSLQKVHISGATKKMCVIPAKRLRRNVILRRQPKDL